MECREIKLYRALCGALISGGAVNLYRAVGCQEWPVCSVAVPAFQGGAWYWRQARTLAAQGYTVR